MGNKATDHIVITDASKYALAVADSMGMVLTSGYRSPGHNAEVGGSKTSDHMKGCAYDFSADRKTMLAFADKMYKSGKFKQVIFDNHDYKTGAYIGGHQDHVHVGWYADGQNTNISTSTNGLGIIGAIIDFIQKLLGGIKIDGIFGTETKKAVQEFQKKNDLVVDGIVGNKTWVKLSATSKVFF